MKYIKEFFNFFQKDKIFDNYSPEFNYADIKDEVLDLIDDYLPYLRDKGFRFDWFSNPRGILFLNKDRSFIEANQDGTLKYEQYYFHFSDVKDDIIPFLTLLNNKYPIKSVCVSYSLNNNSEEIVTLDHLINDYKDNKSIVYILFNLK